MISNTQREVTCLSSAGLSIRVRIRKDLTIDMKVMTAKEVERIGQKIIQLVADLNDFMEQHIPEPPKA